MVVSASDLLQTKLTIPPARTELVSRPRLTELFNFGLPRSLTLISAPAGFGKTTLLSEWLSSETGKVPVAWVSLDEDDNDPGRFLTYLIWALAKIGDFSGDELLSLLQSLQPPPPKVVLTAVISQLELIPGRFALALDDYHLITNQVVHEALIFLLDHLPAQMHLILISREDPPLPLARLRGRGHLVEIRADDLRFTAEEVGLFLQQLLGIALSLDQIEDLETRTEGWIAGLQLAALAMQGREDLDSFISAFTGSHRFILDYLSDEVMCQQPDEVRRFLQQCSILGRMCGSLCDAVTGGTGGQAALEFIERSNLFLIPLDDERHWYRFHHLFGEMLQRQLQLSLSEPDEMVTLHRRASDWFEQHSWAADAVEHAFRAQDYDQAALLIQRHAERIWMRGELATVLRWMQLLPEEQIRSHPRLALTYAFILTLIDDSAGAESLVASVENALSQEPQHLDEASHKALLGQAAIVRATLSILLGEPGERTIAAGLQALQYLPESELRWRAWATGMVGNAYFSSNGDMNAAEAYLKDAIRLSDEVGDQFTSMIAVSRLTRMYIVQGKLRQALALTDQQLRRDLPLTAYAQAQLDHSLLLYEFNDLAAAMDEARVARETFEGYLLSRFQIDACVIMARLKWTQGKFEVAEQLVQQAVEAAQAGSLGQSFVAEDAWQTWLWLKAGKLDNAAQWAQAVEPVTSGDLNPAEEFEHMTLVRVQIAQGRLVEAAALLARLFAAANDAGRMGRVIAICVLQALVARLQGRTDTAMKSLSYALSLAEPEGYVRTFVDEGAAMAALLREAQKRGISIEYVTSLLAAFDHQGPMPINAPNEQRVAADIVALSERELEVLRLIADGASNREIAEALVVSVGTVKKHLNNIFLSLDVHSRMQAVATARHYDLL